MNDTSSNRVLSTTPGPAAPTPAQEQAPAEKPRKRWPWAAAALIVVAGGAYYFMSGATPPPEEADASTIADSRAVQLLPIEVTTIQPGLLQDQISVAGSLAPVRQSPLSFLSGGQLEEVLVKTGEFVAAGTVVARLDVSDFNTRIEQQQNAIAATEAQLDLARKQLASTQSLASKGVASQSALDSARAAVNAQEANLAAQKAQLESIRITLNNATLTAPFDGYVSSRNAEPGQTVGAGAAVVTVVDLSRMEFEATAPVSAAAQLKEGQTVGVTVEGLRGETFEGTVERISPVAVAGTRSIPIFIAMDNPENRLRGGMFATGRVTVAEAENAVAVPTPAIRTDDEGTFVLTLKDGKLERTPVEVKRTWNGDRLTEVSGLSTGDVAVSAALPDLRPGVSAVLTGE